MLQVRHTVLTARGAQGRKRLTSHLSKGSHHLYDESCCPVRNCSVSSCNKGSLHSDLCPTSTSGNAFPAVPAAPPARPSPVRRAAPAAAPGSLPRRAVTPPGHPGSPSLRAEPSKGLFCLRRDCAGTRRIRRLRRSLL